MQLIWIWKEVYWLRYDVRIAEKMYFPQEKKRLKHVPI